MLVVEPTTARMTSIAREPELRESVLMLLHATCATALEARGELAA